MNWQGWTFMIAAWAFIGGLFIFSFKRILFGKKLPDNDQNKKERQQ